jgi:N-acetylneuraminic acid mutarotase
MTDLRERLRAVDEIPVPELLAEARRRAEKPGGPPSWQEGPRDGRLVAGLVAFALFIGGSVLAARVFLEGDAVSPEPRADAWAGVPVGWSRLPDPPFARSDPATVWTGRELILWGGGTDYNANFFADGAAYDPEAGWRSIADGPLSARAYSLAAWTGSEVLIWGGSGTPGPLNDGAAYSPDSDTWRMLPPAPWSLPAPAAHAWTGKELVLFGSSDWQKEEVSGMAYDPAADAWRTIASAPLALNEASTVWTGTEMIVYGSELNGGNRSATRWPQGMAYDPEANSWRVIQEHRISPQASWANWTGTEMLVWDYETGSALYDPVSNSWREPNAIPMEFSECYPYSVRTATSIFAWFCGQMASFDIERDAWEPVETGPVERSRNDPQWSGLPVAAGDVVVMFLRDEARCCELDQMWAYRP